MANIPQIPPKPKKPNHTDPSSSDYTPPPRDAPPVANDSSNSATQVQENPWDFWGEMAQAILDVSKVLDTAPFIQEVNEKLFGGDKKEPTPQPAPNDIYQKPKEEFFYSRGRHTLKRYYQALYYENPDYTYGMDCNASCMMYFLQSYGLIPPDMTRKEFECIFTPLKPDFNKHITVSEHNKDIDRKKTPQRIKMQGKYIDTRENILDGFFLNTEYFLRGKPNGGAIIPVFNNSADTLYNICLKFEKLYNTDETFKFLKDNIKYGFHDLSYTGISNVYKELQEGNYYPRYFEKHVIFVGIITYVESNGADIQPSHYALIVNSPTKKVFDDIEFWVYPSDDPLNAQTYICVPISDDYDNATLRKAMISNRHHAILKNCAIGVTKKSGQ